MDRKRILRVGAIVAVAGATGFVMQSQDRAQPGQRIAAAVTTTPTTAAAVTAASVTVAPVTALVPAIAETAAPVEIAPTRAPEVPGAQATTLAAAPACDADLALIARPGAMLDLGLLAPCRPDQRVLIRHGGLVVSVQTSASGTLVASIPALQTPATVTLAFADGSSVKDTAEVPDLAFFDRFGVQWMAEDAFQLHAYEAGAPGQTNHVFASAPGIPSASGGFLARLGDPATDRALMAEVYSWPAGKSALDGSVTLDIEAEVTATTCDREILGETLQLTAGRLTVRDLTITMPGCDATGEFVVLPNPVMPEKLAAN